MESKRAALNVAGVIFLLMSVAHVVRFIFRTSVIVGDFTVPHWYSLVAAAVAFLLSLWMFKSLK
ncbi:MAG: hypothetical protein HY585_04380 [Candidatus Omnitrophica bacterium]|nr:hypothetical protein [Candidatus Omnitrophota bacterium]